MFNWNRQPKTKEQAPVVASEAVKGEEPFFKEPILDLRPPEIDTNAERVGLPAQDDDQEARIKGELSRRHLLKFLAAQNVAVATGAVVTAPIWARASAYKVEEPTITTSISKSEAPPVEPGWWKDQTYVLPPKLRVKLHPLEAHYIQPANNNTLATQKAPKELSGIDFGANLKKMLSIKIKLTEGSTEKASIYNSLGNSYQKLWETNSIRRVDLPEFARLIKIESIKTHHELTQSIDRIVDVYLTPALGADRSLKREEAQKMREVLATYLLKIANHISPEMMMAYIAAELMPAPKRSAAMLGFLTEHAGLEFLARVPAIGDKLVSHGPFQLTKYVIGKGMGGVMGRGSVTQLLRVMGKQDFIPSSLGEFDSIEEHIRGGYLVAFMNVLTLTEQLLRARKYEELTVLAESVDTTGGDEHSSKFFLEFLSAAHHRPAVALPAARKYLTVNALKNVSERDASLKKYFSAANDDVRGYAERATGSYEAVQEELAQAA